MTTWLGDSVLFFVPVNADDPGMHSEPQGPWDSPQVDYALGWSFAGTEDEAGVMADAEIEVLNNHIDGDGLLVIAATDGLFDPIRHSQYGRAGRFAEDPTDNSIGFAIPAETRSSASATATALMGTAKTCGLDDNAAVVVALARRHS